MAIKIDGCLNGIDSISLKQKLLHVATVNEHGYVDWADVGPGCRAGEEVRTAIQDIVDDME